MQELKEEVIYLAAKELFYELGYKKTTMAKISERAGISNGLISYYYKKQDFIERLFKEYIDNINQTITRDVGDLLDNTFQRYILVTMVSDYFMINISPEFKRLRDELFQNDASPNSMHRIYRDMFRTILSEFEITISEEEFFLYSEVLYTSKLKLDSDLYSEKIYLDKSIVFDFFSSLFLRLAGVSKDKIESNIIKAKTLFDKIDFSEISLFS